MQIDQLGRSGKFDELRAFLRSAGYAEEFLRARFGLERAEQFERAVESMCHLRLSHDEHRSEATVL